MMGMADSSLGADATLAQAQAKYDGTRFLTETTVTKTGAGMPAGVKETMNMPGNTYAAKLANKNKIAFMTPIHLISILKMTAYMWRVDKQQKHAEEVANRAGLLLDKYSNFSEAFSNIAEKLQDAMASYEIAHNRLTEGKGSLHTQMELLEEAGMKGKKSISKPKSLD